MHRNTNLMMIWKVPCSSTIDSAWFWLDSKSLQASVRLPWLWRASKNRTAVKWAVTGFKIWCYTQEGYPFTFEYHFELRHPSKRMSIGRGEKSGSFCSPIVRDMLISSISLNKLILIRMIFIELQGRTQSLLVPKLPVIRIKIKWLSSTWVQE